MTKFYVAALAALPLTAIQPAHAGWLSGWFGPSTYDECVLDGMKGRPQYMMSTVASDCKSRFCTYSDRLPTNEEQLEERRRWAEWKKKDEACGHDWQCSGFGPSSPLRLEPICK
jgi:hypothetical protein